VTLTWLTKKASKSFLRIKTKGSNIRSNGKVPTRWLSKLITYSHELNSLLKRLLQSPKSTRLRTQSKNNHVTKSSHKLFKFK
jgi:hypothetical protein